jgi:hypothetical protein
MSMSLRSHLVAGVAAVATTALIASPTTVQTYPSALANEPVVTARVDLAASVKPIVLEPLRPEQVATARAVISRIDPESTFAAAAVAAPQNSASDWVTGAYQWLQYWVNYGVELADYVLQFVPFGYFIGDQITIFYDFLITPIADSVVYGLINPVLNDPLNLSTWTNGINTVASTTVTSLINTAIVEFNYFFGWLIPPLPPLPIPPLPFAAQTVESLETVEDPSLVSARMSATLEETVAAETDADLEGAESGPKDLDVTEPQAAEAPAGEVSVDTTTNDTTTSDTTTNDTTTDDTAAGDIAPEPDTTPKPDRIPKPKPSKSTSGTVSAQGEVRGGVTATPAGDTPAGAAASGSDKPASTPTSTAPGAGVDQTGSTGTTDDTDTTKAEKKDASPASA